MAELEIHQEKEHRLDPSGQKIGILAAVLAVFLAMVTIASHRTHTDGIVLKTEANDQWQHYQSQRIKYHNLELGEDLITLLGAKNGAVEKALQKYQTEKERYKQEGEKIREEAREMEQNGKLCASILGKVCSKLGSSLRRSISFREKSSSQCSVWWPELPVS